jgi:hypothetical protein
MVPLSFVGDKSGGSGGAGVAEGTLVEDLGDFAGGIEGGWFEDVSH